MEHGTYTYEHRVLRTGLPVRSAVLKPQAGQLVAWWVATCESWLLYVFVIIGDGNLIHPLSLRRARVARL